MTGQLTLFIPSGDTSIHLPVLPHPIRPKTAIRRGSSTGRVDHDDLGQQRVRPALHVEAAAGWWNGGTAAGSPLSCSRHCIPRQGDPRQSHRFYVGPDVPQIGSAVK